jgi:hypothetical protein
MRLRDARIFWPPDAVWATLRNPQRLELGGGLALIAIAVLTSVMQRRD